MSYSTINKYKSKYSKYYNIYSKKSNDKCFCGSDAYLDYPCCGISHDNILNKIKYPKIYYNLVISAARDNSDIAWYDEDNKTFRVDVIFWNSNYARKNKIQSCIREYHKHSYDNKKDIYLYC